MNIIKDQDLIQHIGEYDVILVGTSIMNALGNGFQKKVALNFPMVNNANMSEKYGDARKLGTVKVVNTKPIFCLCYINKGRRRPDLNPDYLDYEALEKCLSLIHKHFLGKKIATTLIGGSLYDGDGDRDRILSIIENTCPEIDIYDYTQTDHEADFKHKWGVVLASVKTADYKRIKNQYYWERAFGELHPLPPIYNNVSSKEIKTIINNLKNERL